MNAARVPQHLELDDVVAWGLGAVDLIGIVGGCAAGWWLYLAVPVDLPLRIAIAVPPVAIAGALSLVRLEGRSLRAWLMVAVIFALRPRLLVSGGCR